MANGIELSPKLPECFLIGPQNHAGMVAQQTPNNTSIQHDSVNTANTNTKRPLK